MTVGYHVALAILLASLFTGGTQGGDFTVMCYFTNWAQWRPGIGAFYPEDIQPYLCTHIIYAFNDLSANSLTIVSSGNDRDIMSRVQKLKQSNPNLKILLALGGATSDNSGFNAAVSTAAKRQLFAQNTVQFLRNNGFDGLDIDWEIPQPEKKVNLTLTLAALRSAFEEDSAATGRVRLLLTAAVWSYKPVVEVTYEVDKIHLYLDYIMVMAYDFYGSWSQELGHNSPLYVPTQYKGVSGPDLLSQNATMFWWHAMGAPREKLVMGLSTYGRTFQLTSPDLHRPGDSYNTGVPGGAGPVTGEAGHLAYYEICQLLNNGFTRVFEEDTQVPYAFGQRSGNWEWITYDDVASMTAKAQYIVSTGLGGAMFWNLDKDDFKHNACGQGRYPLIRTMSDILLTAIRTTTTTTTTTMSSTVSLTSTTPSHPAGTSTSLIADITSTVATSPTATAALNITTTSQTASINTSRNTPDSSTNTSTTAAIVPTISASSSTTTTTPVAVTTSNLGGHTINTTLRNTPNSNTNNLTTTIAIAPTASTSTPTTITTPTTVITSNPGEHVTTIKTSQNSIGQDITTRTGSASEAAGEGSSMPQSTGSGTEDQATSGPARSSTTKSQGGGQALKSTRNPLDSGASVIVQSCLFPFVAGLTGYLSTFTCC